MTQYEKLHCSMPVCSAIHRWLENYTFNANTLCDTGNYSGFCGKAIQLQTPLQTSQVIESVINSDLAAIDPLNENLLPF